MDLFAQQFFHSRGWIDGLPVVPLTADVVNARLQWVLNPPDQLVGVDPAAHCSQGQIDAFLTALDGCADTIFPT
jgi:hypothetical protein